MARRMMALALPFALGACCEVLGGGYECSGGGPTWPTTRTPPATDITGRWQVPFVFCSVEDLTMQRNAVRGTCGSTTAPAQTYNVEGYMEGESLRMGVMLAGNRVCAISLLVIAASFGTSRSSSMAFTGPTAVGDRENDR